MQTFMGKKDHNQIFNLFFMQNIKNLKEKRWEKNKNGNTKYYFEEFKKKRKINLEAAAPWETGSADRRSSDRGQRLLREPDPVSAVAITDPPQNYEGETRLDQNNQLRPSEIRKWKTTRKNCGPRRWLWSHSSGVRSTTRRSQLTSTLSSLPSTF